MSTTMKERLEWMLAHFGVSERELAREAGVSETHPGQILQGHSKAMTTKTLKRYTDRWKVNPTWLLTGEGEPLAIASSTLLDWRDYARRYPSFAAEAALAQGASVSDAVLNAAASALGFNKGEGPTEDEARDAIIRARNRSSAYLPGRDATSADLPTPSLKKRKN